MSKSPVKGTSPPTSSDDDGSDSDFDAAAALATLTDASGGAPTAPIKKKSYRRDIAKLTEHLTTLTTLYTVSQLKTEKAQRQLNKRISKILDATAAGTSAEVAQVQMDTAKLQAETIREEVRRRDQPYLAAHDEAMRFYRTAASAAATRTSFIERAKHGPRLPDDLIIFMTHTLFDTTNMGFLFTTLYDNPHALQIHNWVVASRSPNGFLDRHGARLDSLQVALYPPTADFAEANNATMTAAATGGGGGGGGGGGLTCRGLVTGGAGDAQQQAPHLPVLEANGEYYIDGTPIAEALREHQAQLGYHERMFKQLQKRVDYMKAPRRRPTYRYNRAHGGEPELFALDITWPESHALPAPPVSLATVVKSSTN